MNLSQICMLKGDLDDAIHHATKAVELQLHDDDRPGRDKYMGEVAAHFIGPDGIPRVAPPDQHTGHLHFSLARMLLHRVVVRHSQGNVDTSAASYDLRIAAHH